VVDAAEQFLVEQAAVLDPKTFKQTAREIALMANPDGTLMIGMPTRRWSSTWGGGGRTG
jgi:hypothetical protein